ncbi:pyridoxal-phosphate dependent enzyme [Gammaproteobacteria bacterium AS21]
MSLHIHTPVIQSLRLSRSLSANVWLKIEALQPSGSFKTRGVGYACETYVGQGAKAFISSSGGNAGLAVAYAGRRLNVPVTVVVPTTTKQSAIELITLEGATVIVHGQSWLEAHEYALEKVSEEVIYIHPFDDPLLWQGHASLIDEVVEDGVTPDLVVLSVGGGGLLAGVVEGLLRNNLKHVPVLAVETKGADSFAQAVNSDQHVALANISSIATSLGATKVSEHAFTLAKTHPIHSHVVTDKQAVSACLQFLSDNRLLVEPACGASLAAVYDADKQVLDIFADKKNILVVVCGGVGASIEQLNDWNSSL